MADGSGHACTDAFLGVERSLTGRAWRRRPVDAAAARAHGLREGLAEPVARALASRGVGADEAEPFLRPTLKALFPDPSCFLEMDRAAEVIVDAVAAGRRCVVFADYDVDGAASGALLVRWFRALGVELATYVPDRLLEGYGPSPAAFRRLQSEGAELVITVDCGAAAHQALEAAADIGLPVVVIDHHLMRGDAPPAAALVNPNRPGCGSGQGVLAAAGVVFVLLAALNREARARGLFSPHRPEPDLRRWLDLAALGAICDVTQLTGFNRALAALGLRRMAAWETPGLAALAEIAGAKGDACSTFHAGFILGPRINAGGRIGRADLGLRLLSTDDPAEARVLAAELDALNLERRALEAEVFHAACAQAEAELARDPDAPVLVVAGQDWRPGVVGIVAGRLRERFRRPAVVVGVDPSGVGRGSGRSQPGVNLGRAVNAAWEAGLLLAGGGHAMAAGLTVRAEVLDALRAFLREQLASERFAAEAADVLDVDALVTPEACDRALWSAFQVLQPHGPGNPEPLFALAGVRVAGVRPVKGGHVRVELAGEDGRRLRAVAWRAAETDLGRALVAQSGALHVAGRLRPDDWMGREAVELEIEDAADPRRRT